MVTFLRLGIGIIPLFKGGKKSNYLELIDPLIRIIILNQIIKKKTNLFRGWLLSRL